MPAAVDLEAVVGVFSPSFQISFTLLETSRDSFGQRGKARRSMNLILLVRALTWKEGYLGSSLLFRCVYVIYIKQPLDKILK